MLGMSVLSDLYLEQARTAINSYLSARSASYPKKDAKDIPVLVGTDDDNAILSRRGAVDSDNLTGISH